MLGRHLLRDVHQERVPTGGCVPRPVLQDCKWGMIEIVHYTV